jgi:hypothetical protein
MEKEKSTTELKSLDEFCMNTMRALGNVHRNLDAMAEIETTRASAMVRTKIDEAMMWLEKYHEGVSIDLAHKTCR